MDWLKIHKKYSQFLDKYKYVLLIIALGMFLMMLPSKKETTSAPEQTVAAQSYDSLEEKLENILGQIRNVGKVQVMLTEQSGPETIYQVDEDRTEGEGSLRAKTETVILSGSGTHSGLVQTVTPPTYLGAIIVCQGAGSPTVRLAVATAVSAVTGISMDRISVLEMK